MTFGSLGVVSPAVLYHCNGVYGIAKNGEVLVSMGGSDFHDLP